MSKKLNAAAQKARFVATARELGADESVAAFEEKLKRIASVKPKHKPKPSKKRT